MFLKYISVGVVNTLLTLIVTFFCYKIFHIDYKVSYALGFFAGFVNSIILNNIYTFKDRKNDFNSKYIIKFSAFFVVAFLISEIVLIAMGEQLHVDKSISILISMATYTLLSFFLFDKFVFTKGVSKC